MEEKITFNFFEDSIEESINKIAKYFHLDECAVKKYINSFEEPADITMQKFVVDFGINLGTFDSANARIIGRHMTAMTKEGLEDIITKGLLDLIGVLTEDGMCIFIAHSWHVETVVLLSHKETNGK